MKLLRILFLIVIVLLTSCLPPQSKTAYLTQYEQFILRVRETHNHPDFDWNKENKTFENFSKTYYQRFETQFSFPEKVILKKYEVEYLLVQTIDEAKIIGGVAYDDYKRLQDSIKDYIVDGNMANDIKFLMKEVSAINSLAANVINQVLEAAKTNGSLP